MKRFVSSVLALGVVGGILYLGWYAATIPPGQSMSFPGRKGGGGGPGGEGSFPAPVLTAEVKRATVPVTTEGVGTAKPRAQVTVKPQIDGRLLSVHFKEGQEVKKGDVLAKIDPAMFQAAYDQAAAKKTLTEAQLNNAKRDLDRFTRIPGVIAEKTVDTQRALVAQLTAQLKADEAAIASAKTTLDYAVVTAPLSGRTGIRLVDEGNVVRAGDAGIVTITEVRPITIQFTLPQQQLGAVNRSIARGTVAVEALDQDGKTVLDRGVLDVVDNQVDTTTGTIKMKAELPNANLQLWPGQFVNVRVTLETLQNVVVVPSQAVQRGPQGTFVYLASADQTARVREVTVRQQTEAEAVIATGLEGGETVITSGFNRLKDGQRILIAPTSTQPTGTVTSSAPQAAPKGAPGGGGGGGRFQRIREACGPDIATHCASAGREGMRACLEANKAKFSPGCQTAIDTPADAPAAPAAKSDAPKTDAPKAEGPKGEGRRKREAADGASPQSKPETRTP
ncbi:MAG: hypothetical protein RL291_1975 [Pseudomonadota bacterium]